MLVPRSSRSSQRSSAASFARSRTSPPVRKPGSRKNSGPTLRSSRISTRASTIRAGSSRKRSRTSLRHAFPPEPPVQSQHLVRFPQPPRRPQRPPPLERLRLAQQQQPQRPLPPQRRRLRPLPAAPPLGLQPPSGIRFRSTIRQPDSGPREATSGHGFGDKPAGMIPSRIIRLL